MAHELLHSRCSQSRPVQFDDAERGIDCGCDVFDAVNTNGLIPVYVKLLQFFPLLSS